MKNTHKVLALSLGTMMALSLFAACGNTVEFTAARICYDNLNGGYISVEDTQVTVKDVVSRTAVDGDGKEVDPDTVATFANDTFTAKSEGIITCTLKSGKTYRVEVTPAYTTNPGNQYTGTSRDIAQNGTVMGGCHDPSLIEVEENGKPAYYIFSTGWNTGNEIRRSDDMINWRYMGKATTAKTQVDDITKWLTNDGAVSGTNANGYVQWWAPDIVPAYDGGYWLYTCCVSNSKPHYTTTDSAVTSSGDYSFACIVLFYSDTLEVGSFEYKGVLMQSAIPDGSAGNIDVNSIDPQIIYDNKGNMYMAYGSFGTGNWMLELDKKTGLRKDSIYKNNTFLDVITVRKYRNEAVDSYNKYLQGKEVKTDYYGTMISHGAMEAPVIARHDNVTTTDENGTVIAKDKTYYYSMHSYNGLAVGYQMWGGRSEKLDEPFLSINGSGIHNVDIRNTGNTGNKYMGGFVWENMAEDSHETNIILPGHNDLFTNSAGMNVAAYITRTWDYRNLDPNNPAKDAAFMTQIHQYYLNSMGDICINPNRYGGEIDRSVSKEELLKYTQDNKFKMIVLANDNDAKTSVDVTLAEDGSIKFNGGNIGNWVMYGKGYIKFTFTNPSAFYQLSSSNETVFYGVVRPAWLYEQNKSGFTISCMGHTEGNTRSMAMFMNNYSNITL